MHRMGGAGGLRMAPKSSRRDPKIRYVSAILHQTAAQVTEWGYWGYGAMGAMGVTGGQKKPPRAENPLCISNRRTKSTQQGGSGPLWAAAKKNIRTSAALRCGVSDLVRAAAPLLYASKVVTVLPSPQGHAKTFLDTVKTYAFASVLEGFWPERTGNQRPRPRRLFGALIHFLGFG